MSSAAPTDEIDEPIPLLTPRDGLPAVIVTAPELDAVAARFSAGTGPVAVDAERASGYRYGQRAYLVQLRRRDAGTTIIDPIACPDLGRLGTTIADIEWVLHAAGQDLPCLAEIGLTPHRLFDTELAGRLLGYQRVGLGTIVEEVLGYRLEKGHSAVDWSTRPLPEPWLHYAALDVEVLIELRDALEAELRATGKLDWAQQEFAAIVAAPTPPPRREPWRRTSGIHRVRRPRQLAVVRELWEARDRVAQRRDLSPGRVLGDAAIIEAAIQQPSSKPRLTALPAFTARGARRDLDQWWAAIAAAEQLAEDALPEPSPAAEGPPPARSWPDRDPVAAERLTALRAAVAAIADEHNLPTENLLAPDTVRRLAWQPPEDLSAESIGRFLTEHGARPWQCQQTAKVLAKALVRHRTKESAG
ncbi:MAG TPA: HRDC domain-containing protein [Actinomycetes bacterium]|nr:HRDC domain-containing protein [Actinomycetes bacterium]